MADLLRFRDARGVRHGLWSYTAEGRSAPMEEDPEQFKVLGNSGSGRLAVSVIETVTSKSAPPLVSDTIDAKALRRYTFDLYRVGMFTASARTAGPLVPLGTPRDLRLIDPDGVVVASARDRLNFKVDLPTLPTRSTTCCRVSV